MIDNTIAAAKAVGARIVLPGTIYNFGADAFPVLHEDSPQHPSTRKGAIRVEMEKKLKAAANDGVATLIVRAGDYFGPKTTGNSFFSAVMVRPGSPVKWIVNPAPQRLQPRLGLSSGRRRNHRAADGPRGSARRFRGFQFCRPSTGFRRNARGHRRRPPANRICASGRCRGSRSSPCSRWSGCSARWPRCATSGASRYRSTAASSKPSSEMRCRATPLDVAVRDTLVGLGCLKGADVAGSGSAR